MRGALARPSPSTPTQPLGARPQIAATGRQPRSQRLLNLLQILHRQRGPVSGAHLAHDLGVSLRTLYRDISLLQEQGARIEGEAGLGYVLRPGFLLPPLMFRPDEIEALVLGCRWVAQRGISTSALRPKTP